jgi:hypothetical protein
LALELENNTLLDYKYMMTENGKEIQKNSQYCNKTAKYSSNRQILEQTLSKKTKKAIKKTIKIIKDTKKSQVSNNTRAEDKGITIKIHEQKL